MNRANVLLLLLAINLTYSIKVQVEYDKQRDIIIHNGKVYMPVIEGTESGEHGSEHESEHGEEELVTGASFFFYLFGTLCIEYIKSSPYSLCRSYVWTYRWLSIYR
jgi:hypothetical protein